MRTVVCGVWTLPRTRRSFLKTGVGMTTVGLGVWTLPCTRRSFLQTGVCMRTVLKRLSTLGYKLFLIKCTCILVRVKTFPFLLTPKEVFWTRGTFVCGLVEDGI